MQKQGLCLDFDGTIIDSGQEGLRRLERVAKRMNLPHDLETLEKARSLWGTPAVKLIKFVWPNADTKEFHTEWSKIDSLELIPLFPGTFEALEKLSHKFYLSILTNRGRQSTEFQTINFRHLLNFIVAHEDVQFHKPDPQSMEPVITQYKKLGVDTRNIVYVGDTVEVDWKLCINTSINFYAVTTGINTYNDFRRVGLRPERILNSVADLPNILL